MDEQEQYRLEYQRNENIQIVIVAGSILAFVALALFFGRECNREDTKYRQLRRDAVIRCIESGTDPLHCDKAVGF